LSPTTSLFAIKYQKQQNKYFRNIKATCFYDRVAYAYYYLDAHKIR